MSAIAFFQTCPLAFFVIVFLVGLAVGSFLNVIIVRLPAIMEREWRRECCNLLQVDIEPDTTVLGLAWPGSRCPKCGHSIRAWENIPVLSYCLLGGRCSSCKSRISIRYPLVEVLCGSLSVVVAWRYGLGFTTVAALTLTWVLIVLSAIDIDCQLLPDNITLPMLWLGVAVNLGGYFTTLESSILGAMAGYGSLWLVFHLFRLITGKDGMGYGDFKLLALLGAWMGWQYLPLIILLSSACAAVVGICLIATRKLDRDNPIPFGPYLAAAGWISLVWGHDIMQLYLYGLAPN